MSFKSLPKPKPDRADPIADPKSTETTPQSSSARLTPAQRFALQRSQGNQAVMRMAQRPQISRIKGIPQIQRLIAVNPSGTPQNDYAIMKVVHQLSAYPNAGAIQMLNAGIDFSGMAAGEKVYIVSHGRADDGELQNITPATLIGWLNGAHGVPAHFGGIVILACYSGEAVAQNDSLAEQVAEGLNVVGKSVQGAVGFGFGSTRTAETGKSSVLSSALRTFYAANDLNALKQEWGARTPNHHEGVLINDNHVQYVNQHETIRNQLVASHGAGGADGYIDTYMKHFRDRVAAIQTGLQNVLTRIPGDTVQNKLNNMLSIRYAGVMTNWNFYLKEQYELFYDYYLWTPEDDAYAEFTS